VADAWRRPAWFAALLAAVAAVDTALPARAAVGPDAVPVVRLAAAGGAPGEPTQDDPTEGVEAPGGDEAVPEGRIRFVDGEVVVTLGPALAARVGIVSEALGAVRRPAAFDAFARVVDPSPLLAARSRYDQSRATEAVHQVDMDVSRQEYRRLRQLSERGSLASPQSLQLALGEFRRSQALVRAEQIRQANIYDEIAQSWSVAIADALVREESALHDGLVRRALALVEVTLPPGRELPGLRSDIEVVLPGAAGRERRVRAEFVSAAPATDARIQGETWYFTMPGDSVRAGMRLTALVTDEDEERRGVLVPEAAAVWHEGRPWAYLDRGDGEFSRRSLADATELAEGWFLGAGNAAGLSPGDRVVVAGATTLLSEEFRWQIPREDDDDDD
jgi:hypothetical protein